MGKSLVAGSTSFSNVNNNGNANWNVASNVWVGVRPDFWLWKNLKSSSYTVQKGMIFPSRNGERKM